MTAEHCESSLHGPLRFSPQESLAGAMRLPDYLHPWNAESNTLGTLSSPTFPMLLSSLFRASLDAQTLWRTDVWTA